MFDVELFFVDEEVLCFEQANHRRLSEAVVSFRAISQMLYATCKRVGPYLSNPPAIIL